MTIYADMMTNLMLFFLMLYAMSRFEMDARARSQFQQAFGNEMLGRRQKVSEPAAAHKMTEGDIVKEASKIKGFIASDEARIRLSLPGEVLFDSGSSDLKSSASTSLQQVLEMIKKIPNKIMIEGHTDDDGESARVLEGVVAGETVALNIGESLEDGALVQPVRRQASPVPGPGAKK